MKIINFRFILIVLTLFFTFGFSNVNAQEERQENSVCSALKNAGLSVADNKVLVAGEVYSPQIFEIRERGLTLMQSMAMAGGTNQNTSIKNVRVFKCSRNSETAESIVVANYEKIKKGIESDLKLKGGEIIFLPHKNSRKIPSVLKAFEPQQSIKPCLL